MLGGYNIILQKKRINVRFNTNSKFKELITTEKN